MFGELMAVVGMANETNRLANGYRVPVDAAFEHGEIDELSVVLRPGADLQFEFYAIVIEPKIAPGNYYGDPS